ncbi:MAG: hypothetical protein LBR30_00360 [Clostridioides sp.]|jgi:hypothetical protein|nr:hypothetical protein [Clostridioides sp.]
MKKELLILMIITLLVTITGCEKLISNKSTNEEYKYAVISSTMTKDKSIISLYDENGKFIKDKKIKYGGVGFSGFKESPDYIGDDVFMMAPAIYAHTNNYTLKINKNTLKASEVPATSPNTSTFFTTDDKYLYSGSASPYETNLDKTDIKTNKIVKTAKVNVDGGVSITQKDDKLYLVSYGYENEKIKMYLSVLNKESLKLENKIDLGYGDKWDTEKITENYIWITKNSDEKGNLLDEVLRVNIKDFRIDKIKLPFKDLYQTLNLNDYIYVTQNDPQGQETDNLIARINIKNNDIETFKLKNDLSICQIDENKNEFISTDREKMYIYNLDDFTLKKSFKINQYDYDCLLFSSFFIK